jgi:thymidine phosphorylase
MMVALACVELGAGRARKTDSIDPAVGVEVHYKVGDQVGAGDVMFTVHANNEDQLERAIAQLEQAPVYDEREQQPLPMFYDTIYND